MKRTLAIGLICLGAYSSALAGGLLNNTSMHALYLRSLARNASTAIDAAFYNPAGLVFTPDGWRYSINSQTVFQKRDITTTFAPFAFNGGQTTKHFEGTATAPIVPTIMASYKKGDWAFSAVAGIFGGGGKARFNQGLPQFEAAVSMIPTTTQALRRMLSNPALTGTLPPAIATQLPTLTAPLTAVNKYTVDSHLEGQQYTLGLQLGATYRVTPFLSAHLGARLSYAYNTYTGYIRNIRVNNQAGDMVAAPIYFAAEALKYKALAENPAIKTALASLPTDVQQQVQTLLRAPAALAAGSVDKRIEVKQTGLGVAPIVGLHLNYGGLNVGARYEFRTALDVKNDTKANDSGMEQFKDSAKVANDMPAVLALGASYRILPQLTASVGFNHFFEKQARMSGDKQKSLSHNTSEYLFGLEWNALSWLDVSGGVQITRKGVTDDYQSNIHFDMSSNSYGFGVGVHLTKELQLNLAYMISDYRKHTKEINKYVSTALPGVNTKATEVYSRKNQIFSLGLDYTL